MYEIKLHRRVRNISLSTILIIILAGIAVTIFTDYGVWDNITVWTVAADLVFTALLVSYSIAHEEKRWIRKAAKYSLIIYPLIFILTIILLVTRDADMDILTFSIIAVVLFFSVVPLMHLFVFSDATRVRSTIVLILLIICSIVIKRYHIIGAGPFLTAILFVSSISFYIYGIRCLYLTEKVPFLKNIGFFSSLIVSITFLGLLFKLQHWPGGNVLLSTGEVSLVVLTLIGLITLPSSGYADWQPFHKKILLRLLLPWILIFFLFIIRFLLPGVHNIIWNKETRRDIGGFGMKDYKIELRNNLKPE